MQGAAEDFAAAARLDPSHPGARIGTSEVSQCLQGVRVNDSLMNPDAQQLLQQVDQVSLRPLSDAVNLNAV